MTLGAETVALQPEPRGVPGHLAVRSQEEWGASHRRPQGLSLADTWASAACLQRRKRTRSHCSYGQTCGNPPWSQE